MASHVFYLFYFLVTFVGMQNWIPLAFLFRIQFFYHVSKARGGIKAEIGKQFSLRYWISHSLFVFQFNGVFYILMVQFIVASKDTIYKRSETVLLFFLSTIDVRARCSFYNVYYDLFCLLFCFINSSH